MRRSILIAGVLSLGLVGWVASGNVAALRDNPEELAPKPAAEAKVEAPLFRVGVREIAAELVVREVVVNGHTEPARTVELRAEADGRVVEVPVDRGESVKTGDLLLRIDKRDREAALAYARANFSRADLEADAARKLNKKGFQAETALAQKLAELAQAQAVVQEAEIALSHTDLQAPFDGVLDKRTVEIGDYVDVGDEVATLVELDPLVVAGDVAEVDIAGIRPGAEGYATTVSGTRLEGRVRYVAAQADPATRTFRIELEVANPDNRVGAGMSAQLHIPSEPVLAHRVNPSLLVLDEEGRVGIRGVDGEATVTFYPAAIIRSQADWVWLAGLPANVRVITSGQGFVREGQKVTIVQGNATNREGGA